MVWLTGGALAVCLVMIVGLLGLILWEGAVTFWPRPMVRVDLHGVLDPTEGHSVYMGPVTRSETFPLQATTIARFKSEAQRPLRRQAIELLEPAVSPALQQLAETERLDYALDAVAQSVRKLEDDADSGDLPKATRSTLGKVIAAWPSVETAPTNATMDQALAAEQAFAGTLSAASKAVRQDVLALRQKVLGGDVAEPDELKQFTRDLRFVVLRRIDEHLTSAQRRSEHLRKQMLMLVAVPRINDAVRTIDDPNADFLSVLDDLRSSGEPGVANAAAFVMDHIQVEHRRRLFRTANYDLTRRHFHWIPDYAIANETEPEWAVVVERLREGRFHGKPIEFVIHAKRQVNDREQMLLDAQNLVTRGMRLVDRAERGALARAFGQINQKLSEVRLAQSREFLQGFEDQTEIQLSLRLLNGQTVDANQWDEQTPIVEVTRVWRGPEAAWRQMVERQPAVRERRDRYKQLQEHEIGQINKRLSDARVELRGAALAHDKQVLEQTNARREAGQAGGFWPVRDARRLTFLTRLVQPAQSLIVAEATQAELKRQTKQHQVLLQQLRDTYGSDDPVTEACAAAVPVVAARAEEQIAEARARVEELKAELVEAPDSVTDELDHFMSVARAASEQTAEVTGRMQKLEAENQRYVLHVETAQGQVQPISLGEIVRIFPANRATESLADMSSIYLSRWGEFLADEPRQANSEGGIFPAIIGTVLMTIIMAFAVVPFGVMAALYLREYAKGGVIVSAVRIAINNLAGVPSIVFGVFGLGFFCYAVGDFVDAGPVYELPAGRWFIYLGVLVGFAVLGALLMAKSLKRPGQAMTPTQNVLRHIAGLLWISAAIGVIVLVTVTPFFDGFFEARKLAENQPTFGKGALVWASLTLALLTLPVVIVATEEALAAVPNSMREGSYACGASKWQTIKRIVLPRAMPGIMTGMILAMARGAGEVAPLMLVGAVKLAPELPISADPGEAFGINRSFMHMGYHIYDLAVQSQNSEAAKPMVFTTTLLLIAIVAALNLSAIWLRTRLRRRFVASAF